MASGACPPAIAVRLADRFHDLLDELFEDRIVNWTLVDARAYARIMEDKRRSGAPLDDHVPDTFLAAAAASRGFAVLTRNASEFRLLRAQVVAFAEQRRHDLRRRTVDEA